jgi:hypothetical protein
MEQSPRLCRGMLYLTGVFIFITRPEKVKIKGGWMFKKSS